MLTDGTSNTLDLNAALDVDDIFVVEMLLAATGNRFQSTIFPDGLNCGTGITVAADLVNAGGDPAADDNDAFILYTDNT